METIAFLLMVLCAGLVHGFVLRTSLPETARTRGMSGGIIGGPVIVVLGALPFIMPTVVGFLLLLAGFLIMMRMVHDSTFWFSIGIFLADLLILGAIGFVVFDAILMGSSMDRLSIGL